MSMVICENCRKLVDTDHHPEHCPKCYDRLFKPVDREPPADFMEQLERTFENDEPT